MRSNDCTCEQEKRSLEANVDALDIPCSAYQQIKANCPVHGVARDSDGNPIPSAGQIWRSRDPRDDNLRVTVLGSDGPSGFVRIQRFRKSSVRYARFQRSYRLNRAS